MKTKDIILIIAGLGVGYLAYTKLVKAKPTPPTKKPAKPPVKPPTKKPMPKKKKPSKPTKHEGYEYCGANQYKFYCGGKTYCCNTPGYIRGKLYEVEEPIRIVYNVCVDRKLVSRHIDFDTRKEAERWIIELHGDVSDVCLVTAYHVSKPKPPAKYPRHPGKPPRYYPV